MKLKITLLLVAITILSCKNQKTDQEGSYQKDGATGATKIVNTTHYPQEKHLKNIKQLTFGGDNAEAYWSFDSKKIVFQANTKSFYDSDIGTNQ